MVDWHLYKISPLVK